jgi:hypothetical protein
MNWRFASSGGWPCRRLPARHARHPCAARPRARRWLATVPRRIPVREASSMVRLCAQKPAVRNEPGNRYYVSTSADAGASSPRARIDQMQASSAWIERGNLGNPDLAPVAGNIPNAVCTVLFVGVVERQSCVKSWHAHLRFLVVFGSRALKLYLDPIEQVKDAPTPMRPTNEASGPS